MAEKIGVFVCDCPAKPGLQKNNFSKTFRKIRNRMQKQLFGNWYRNRRYVRGRFVMHKWGIAKNIVQKVSDATNKNSLKAIKKIDVNFGRGLGIEEEFRFCL